MEEKFTVQSAKYGSFTIFSKRHVQKGNQASIVEGVRDSNGEEVIVKLSRVFPIGYSDDKKPFDKTHILQESNMLNQLRHVNGVPAYYGLHRIRIDANNERLALIMRRVNGETLQQMFARKVSHRFTAREALQFIKGAAEILHDAHKRNIIHCDLKFSNFMTGVSGLSIVDWGSAQLINRQRTLRNVKTKKPIVGTIQFMSYEQVTGRSLDERADIYSLGVVAAVLTYGPAISQRYIFTKGSKTQERSREDLINAIVRGETLKFHVIAPPKNAHEKKIQQVIYNMTAPNKYLRYNSMMDVVSAIDSA